jgi:hypothetical protein
MLNLKEKCSLELLPRFLLLFPCNCCHCSKFSTGCNPHVLAGLSISFEVAGYFQKVGGEMEVP